MNAIAPSGLFRVTRDFSANDEKYNRSDFAAGEVVWLNHTKKSSLEGYRANICKTYRHGTSALFSPVTDYRFNIPMDLISEIK